MLTTEERLTVLLTAPEHILKKVDDIIKGKPTEQADPDRKTYNIKQAADILNVSRTSVWRMLRDGHLPYVELRPGGSRRIPSAAITEFARKGGAK